MRKKTSIPPTCRLSTAPQRKICHIIISHSNVIIKSKANEKPHLHKSDSFSCESFRRRRCYCCADVSPNYTICTDVIEYTTRRFMGLCFSLEIRNFFACFTLCLDLFFHRIPFNGSERKETHAKKPSEPSR
jgi:hypothetical protein